MEITSDTVLDVAYEWLCQRRCDYSANADVWASARLGARKAAYDILVLARTRLRSAVRNGQQRALASVAHPHWPFPKHLHGFPA